MRTDRVDLAIVGAGPAGLSAALQANELGLETVVLDEGEQPGGQIFRQPPSDFRVTDGERLGRDFQRGRELLDRVASAGIGIESNTVVWNVEPGKIACCRDGGAWHVESRAVILATGAYDRPVPLPGWTLPGVFTSGGVQTLLKSQRLLAGRRVLLSGTGPLNLVLANQLADAGATVVAVLELAKPGPLELLPMLGGPHELLFDGIGYVSRLLRRGIPLMRGWTLLEAIGTDEVSSAIIGRVDSDWRVIEGTERAIDVDTICLGYGLVPSTELSRAMGCNHYYQPELGGWIPRRDIYGESSIPSVFVAGDGSGIAGSLVALEEGQLAGLRVAMRLGRIDEAGFTREARPILRRLSRLARFRAVLDGLSAPRPGLFDRMRPDTLVCRCEDVSLGAISDAVREGACSLKELKPLLRTGMGPCQGRICGPTCVELVARLTGQPPRAVEPFSQRFPVKPIPMTAFLDEQTEPA